MYKIISIVAVCVIAVLACDIVMASFHYHENGTIEDDCPICRFQDSGITSDIGVSSLPLLHLYVVAESDVLYVDGTPRINVAARTARPNAPPCFL